MHHEANAEIAVNQFSYYCELILLRAVMDQCTAGNDTRENLKTYVFRVIFTILLNDFLSDALKKKRTVAMMPDSTNGRNSARPSATGAQRIFLTVATSSTS